VNYVASGLLLPEPLAGHPALELCNTLAGWGEAATREYLASYEHLAVWARERGIVAAGDTRRAVAEAARDPEGALAVLRRARRLREALYAVLTETAGPPDRAAVAAEVERAAAAARLAWTERRAQWLLPTTIELPLLAAARAAGDLLTAPVPVGRCAGHGCGWLFADPRGRRRWCSMAVCGNRAKVRRHAQRASGGR
jgi:predicted RNA-binding Zn ribbon-like protein